MLNHLIIRHMAVVEHLELCFKAGLTILTGETGAGKSILIDALGLTLGDRADPDLIRTGYSEAEVAAIYELSELPSVSEWLKEHNLGTEEECIVRRTISKEGKSRAYINGHLVPVSQIKALGEQLINIHGQHANQLLLKPDHQCVLLDHFAKHTMLIEGVKESYKRWYATEKEYKNLQSLNIQLEKHTLLQYQLQEITELNIQKNEFQTLCDEQKELSHSEEWLLHCENALQILKAESGQDATALLYSALSEISPLAPLTPKLKTCEELLKTALIQIEEAVSEIETFKHGIDLDPKHLDKLNERLSQMYTLARKHRIQPDDLWEYQSKLQVEADALLHLQDNLEAIEQKREAAQQAYQQAAQALSLSRKKAAEQLALLISKSIQSLEMPNGQFKIAFKENPHPSPQGQDDIEFLISTNPGLPLQPLRKIASGGELSRISLAIQVITSQKMTTPTLIFDEVDVGISGKTAETVGKLLRTLGQDIQSLCVTHLPQIAAQGQHHYKVFKTQSKDATTSSIECLNEKQRVEEVARMLGGATITKHALAHAKEMIKNA